MLDTIRSAASTAAALLALSAAASAQDAAAQAADAAPSAAPAATEAAYSPQKVVYHINGKGGEDGKGYNAALGNMRNHIDAVGQDQLDLRVVMHGDGVELLQLAAADQGLQAKIADLKAKGVKFLVCNNTLTARNIDPASLFDVYDDDIVPSGVAEIAKLEGEGFSYIRP